MLIELYRTVLKTNAAQAVTGGVNQLYRRIFFCVLLFNLFYSPASFGQAPDAAETAAFNSAARAFNLGLFEKARNEFAEFVRKFPRSAELPKALLFEAQAALKLGDTKLAASLLTANLPRAGTFAEQYQYSLGEVYLQATNYVAAAAAFGQVLHDFPNSQRALEAAYNQALARFNLKDWAGVIELLQTPDGPFQKQAGPAANSDLVAGGSLLLAQAFMETGQPQEAEKALTSVTLADANPELQWQREFLLCRIHLAEGQVETALAGSSNLVKLATAAALPVRRADSVTVQAGILQQLNNLPAAAAAYELNLRSDVPVERRRESLQKIIDITLKQEALDEAAAKLERLLAEHPGEPGSDVARLKLGELRLKQYVAQSNSTATATNQAATSTNALQLALAQFDQLIKAAPFGPLAPKAQLDSGWCLWELGKITESAAAFKSAVEQLPRSGDQALARFKLGDAYLMMNDYTNALENFQALLNDYRDLPSVSNSLYPQAWYNVLRCSLELNDLSEATRAMSTIVRSYPQSPFADKSMLLLGQQLSASKRPAEARKLFLLFQTQFPESPLLPEVQLAVARSYQQEERPDVAIEKYDQWVVRYATNDLRARAEFDRAVAYYEAGREKNALLLFTNFLAQFGTSELAPLAQNWVADFYFRLPDFVKAEENYQLLYQNTNWVGSDLSYQARMMAGRSAYARQAYRDATNYFVPLINDNTCPQDLLAEAYFALGDTMIAWGAETRATAPTRRDSEPVRTAFTNFQDAKEAFEKIPRVYPTNDLVPRALGRIGDCYLQMAAFDNKLYENAVDAYQKVIAHPKADVSARSLAEIGLATVIETQVKSGSMSDPEPLLKAAFDHYFNVFSSNNLRPGEKIDPPCFKTAALAGAKLAEEWKQWDVALNIYRQMIGVVPSIRAAVERKIKHVEQLRAEKG